MGSSPLFDHAESIPVHNGARESINRGGTSTQGSTVPIAKASPSTSLSYSTEMPTGNAALRGRLGSGRSDAVQTVDRLKSVKENGERDTLCDDVWSPVVDDDTSRPSCPARSDADTGFGQNEKRGDKTFGCATTGGGDRIYSLGQAGELPDDFPPPSTMKLAVGEGAEYLSEFTRAVGGDVVLDRRRIAVGPLCVQCCFPIRRHVRPGLCRVVLEFREQLQHREN